jgi:hypothetical protein
VLPLALGEIVDIAVLGIRADGLRKDTGHVGAKLVHRRHDDVARRLVVELLNALAEVGFHDLDAALFEKWPHVALVGQHRLGLDQRARTASAHDVEHDLVVLGRVPGPMDMRPVTGRVALELLQIAR